MTTMTSERMKHLGYGLVAATLVLLGATGCKSQHDPDDMAYGSRDFKFSNEDDNRPARQIADTQAAVAASEDGQLSAQHFTGGKLNSLGRQKLDLILRGDEGVSPMSV